MPDVTPHIAKREWEAPNLGIASIAANIDTRHEVWIADLVVRRWSVRPSVRRCLRKYRPDILGLSAMSFQYFTARKVARLVKRESPGTLVALGGYHATQMWRELADSPESEVLDFILQGQGDHSFNELLDALEGCYPPESVRRLSFKRGEVFRHNPDRPLEDLREIALPDRQRRVFGGYHFYFNKADVMETSRGCVLRCNFCSMNQMYGTTFRTYNIDRVIADVERMYQQGVRQILIVARLNDFFGDMVVDEAFFDPDSDEPEGIGNPSAALDVGAPPRKDDGREIAFVSTREMYWSRRVRDSGVPAHGGAPSLP